MKNKKAVSSIQEMNELINFLRSEKGCVWLKAQDFGKILEELKSEILELENAVKKGDGANLKEELTDVLWDTLLLLSFAEDEKGFDIGKQAKEQIAKIKRRKPYVFGREIAKTPEEASRIWHRVKQEEKLEKRKKSLA